MDKIKIERTWLQGSPVQVDNLMGNAFVGEAGAHEFLISGKDNAGNVVPITGTITGKFLSSTMTTFALSGYVAEGVASVTLPSECYGAPGQFVVSIFATNGSTTTCIYCGVGSIFRTSTAAIAYPTTTLPDLTLLINQLDDVIASFPADLTHLLGAIAPTFVDNQPFTAGQYVWYNQVLYRFTADHPAGSWAGSADTVVAVIGTELNSTVRYTQQVLTDAQKTVARTNIDAADADDVTDLELTTVQVTPQTFDDNSKSQARSNIGAASSGDLNALSTLVNNQGGYISDLNAVIGTVPTGETVEGQITDLKSALKEYNAVNLLPHLSDRAISSSGVTGSVTDDVIVVNGTTSAPLNIRYYNRSDTLPEWWIPGRDIYVYIEKTGTGLNTTALRIGKYNSDGSTSKIIDIFSSTVFHIPDDFDGVGLYINFYIATARTVDGSFYAYILNTLSNADLTKAVNDTKRMSELKVACFGDSVMWGRDGNGSGSTQTPYTISQAIAKRLNCVCDNYGVGGQGFIHSDGTPNAYDNISGVDLTAYTVMVMCYGVNDGFDTVGEWDSTDESTIMGQFNKILNYVYTQSPNIRLIVFAPWPGRNVGSFPDYWYGDVTVASTGRTSRKILSDTMKRACDYYWIPYIEQYDSPINPLNIGIALPDGVHPSNDFYKLIGDWVAAKISGLL